ncbi:MAG: PIG-L family deacetylase [Armatimonadota bacterium]
MAERKVALAVGAHPDDVEFVMAGTLALLGDAGYELHIFTVANGSCGTASHGQEEIIALRREEAQKAAELIGARCHPGLVNDIEIYYADDLLRRVTAVVREVEPEIVLIPSPVDYMEDHQNTSRLMVTACFCRGMRNWRSDPPRDPTMQDVYVYHAQPHSSLDILRHAVVPSLFVDVSDKIDLKEQMLRCHATQKEWLDVSQGMDSYLATMRRGCERVGEMAPRRMGYAEGFRQHMHPGFSAEDADRLSEVLSDTMQRGADWW